ncbi:hypothetical protein JOQ06_023222 [Pogonophryne albipinna]|uniref:Uncharacterized protein n=1 Tax=Pogonophryne albipinna TaxID=1090488 RepID=A0AAD6BMD8_9TELE|nr:hypothetical protein JOQ06_023222 [Pogonophryne albipinna]
MTTASMATQIPMVLNNKGGWMKEEEERTAMVQKLTLKETKPSVTPSQTLMLLLVSLDALSRSACQRGGYNWGCQTTLPLPLTHDKKAFLFLSPRFLLKMGDTGRVAYRQSHSPEETERRLGKRGQIGEGGGLNWNRY